jgi:hypothetical protein
LNDLLSKIRGELSSATADDYVEIDGPFKTSIRRTSKLDPASYVLTMQEVLDLKVRPDGSIEKDSAPLRKDHK